MPTSDPRWSRCATSSRSKWWLVSVALTMWSSPPTRTCHTVVSCSGQVWSAMNWRCGIHSSNCRACASVRRPVMRTGCHSANRLDSFPPPFGGVPCPPSSSRSCPRPNCSTPQGKAVAGALARLGKSAVHAPCASASASSSPSTARSTTRCSPRPATLADDMLSNAVIEDVVGVASRAPSRPPDADRRRHLPRLARRPRRPARGAPRRCRARRALARRRTTSRASTPSCCPAASATATTCAAARSPPARRSWPRSSTPRTRACRCSASATASRCSSRRTCCPAA